jgi:hypothetical protein
MRYFSHQINVSIYDIYMKPNLVIDNKEQNKNSVSQVSRFDLELRQFTAYMANYKNQIKYKTLI